MQPLAEQPRPEAVRALSPTVLRLGLVSFFADVSSELLYPITPVFLTLVLGSSVFSVGLIEGVAEGVASLLKTYSGSWSDRLQKRKTFIWLGYLFAALAKPLVGSASSWIQVLFARSFDRIGKGIRTAPRDALLAESVSPEQRGKAFGLHRMMDTLGAVVGPLLAIFFLGYIESPSELRWLYYAAAIPGLLAVLIVFSVSEKPRVKTEAVATPALGVSELKSKLKLNLMSKEFKRFLWGWGIFSLANSSDVFLILKAQKSGLSLTYTIVLYAFYNLLYSLASPYLGGLSDRFGRKWILISGLIVFAIVYSLFGFASEPWHFWLLFGVYGTYMAATDGVGKAFAVDLVPNNLKATGLGLLGTVSGLATIVASSVAGLLWDQVGNQWAFLYGAVGAVSAAIILTGLPNEKCEVN